MTHCVNVIVTLHAAALTLQLMSVAGSVQRSALWTGLGLIWLKIGGYAMVKNGVPLWRAAQKSAAQLSTVALVRVGLLVVSGNRAATPQEWQAQSGFTVLF
jgi:hypothetical protein